MNISRDEAQQALAEIGRARGDIRRVHQYGDASPFLILWGCIWLLNILTHFLPVASGPAWMVSIAVGTAVTAWLGIVQGRRRGERMRQAGIDPKQVFGTRFGLTCGAIMLFFVAFMIVAAPLEARQVNAFISLFWTFAYMIAGIWIGWRLAAIGFVASAAILFAYVALDQYYFLVAGIAGGGSLILGGLWLRKI